MSETEIKTKSNDDALELVAFCVGDQEYCVNIMSVREIRGWTKETSLPLTPPFVRGVINLRGSVVPVVDLASRLGLEQTEPSARHVIIIMQIGEQAVGLVVDAVSDILTILKEKIQPTPDVSSEAAKGFVEGVLAMEERMINLLDLSTVLPTDTIEGIAA